MTYKFYDPTTIQIIIFINTVFKIEYAVSCSK